MKKQLNTTAIINELKGSSVFFPTAPTSPRTPTPTPIHAQKLIRRPVRTKNGEPSHQETLQSTSKSLGQSIDPSTNLSVDTSPVLGRPKAFYLTEKQDHDLDIAVEKLAAKVKGRVNQKIDRSTVVRLLLELYDATSDPIINQLAGQLVKRLISQLTSPPIDKAPNRVK